MRQTFIALPEACYRLRLSTYRHAYDMAISGKLGRIERRGNRMFVEERAVARIEAERAAQPATAGRS